MIFSINSTQDLSLDIIQKQIKKERDINRQIESRERTKLTDFYENLQDKDIYLKNYGFKNYDNLPLQTINLTKKIIDKTSLVYKNDPDRSFEGEEESSYAKWIIEEPRFNFFMAESERRKNLLAIILKRPVYRKNIGWRFYIDTQFEPHFLEEDTLNPIGYSIPVLQDTTNPYDKNTDLWWLYLDNKHWFYYQKNSEKTKTDPSFPKGKHNLDMIPVVESRTNFPVEDYWVSGATDLVQSNQAININLNNLNYALHFQAFNYVYISGIDSDEAKKIKVSTTEATALPEGSIMGNLDLNPKLTEMVESIKFHMAAIAKNYNVTMDWEMSGDPSSGFALLVKNIDLMEAREDDVRMAELEEQQIYQLIAKQQNAYKTPGTRLPMDKKLIVDFQEIDFPINQKEELDRWEWEFDHNISTPIDYIQSKEGLTQEEAEKRFEENKLKNSKYITPAQKAINDAFAGLNEPPGNTQQ